LRRTQRMLRNHHTLFLQAHPNLDLSQLEPDSPIEEYHTLDKPAETHSETTQPTQAQEEEQGSENEDVSEDATNEGSND
ncbi:hypothetical protein PIB30_108554, partial [Stylosanthes scabra]|nr:hypothetical protein [Stylosanthes scabra]